MSNVATINNAPQLPAHLARLTSTAITSLNESAISGISTGAHHRISIKQSRWRLLDTQGQETVLDRFDIDVIVVDANPHVSKIYYEGAYDPKAQEAAAPACWSDNGVAPSDRAEKPQSLACATCPHNEWGSKITLLGSKTKSCQDSKKLAVILADNPNGPVYELRIPPASMANFANAVKQLQAHGIYLPHAIVKMSFDPRAEYPRITFQPSGYITEAMVAGVLRAQEGNEAAEVVGKNDRPNTTKAVASSATGTSAQPVVTPPAAPAAAPTLPFPPAAPTATAAAPAPEPKKRRSRKADAAAAPAAQSGAFAPVGAAAAPAGPNPFTLPTPTAQPFAPPAGDVPHATNAAAGVALNPPATDAALDALLEGIV